MKYRIIKTFLVSLIVAVTTNAHADKLYKWVDADGNISYQDRPPPKNAKILSETEVAPSTSIDANAEIDIEKINRNRPEVVVYSVKNCAVCDRLISELKRSKVPHVEIAIENDRKAQSRILEELGSVIMPTLFIGDRIIQPSSEAQLRQELESEGYKMAKDSSVETSEPTEPESEEGES